MKEFTRLSFDAAQSWAAVDTLGQLLRSKGDLEETADIKPFFEAHPELAILIGGAFSMGSAIFDQYSFQFQLFGDFGCDIVVGDSVAHRYAFIELEDAMANSLFRRQGAKVTPEWSSRIEGGFSQIVDWFWKLEDMSRTDEYATRFGSRHADYFGMLLIGRDQHLGHPREENRWAWRSRNVAISGKPVWLVT